MAKYEDVLSINTFSGLNQAHDGHNLDLKYAVGGANFDTMHGGLKAYKSSKVVPISYEDGFDNVIASPPCWAQYRANKNITIAMLSKRWKQGVSGIIPTDRTAYAVMVSYGRIFYRETGQYAFEKDMFANCGWRELLMDGQPFAFANNKFDYVTYEINFGEPTVLTEEILQKIKDGEKTADTFDVEDGKTYTVLIDESGNGYYENYQGNIVTLTVGENKVRIGYDAPVDCLLLTNSTDGMYCVYAPLDSDELKVRYVEVKPYSTDKEIKFGCLARYAERIFGSGIDSDPDKVMYSATYDPFNWEQNNIEPDDGAGDIQQPNWDGDGFKALREFGNQLLLIKRHAVWRLTGTTPSEFVMRKQYGEGTIAEDSVVVIGANAYMFTDTDILVYDGASTRPLKKDILKEYYPVPSNAENVYACAYNGNYVFSFLPGGGEYYFGSGKQCVGVFNTYEGTFNVFTCSKLLGIVAYKSMLYFIENEYASDNTISEDYTHAVMKLAFAGTSQRMEWLSAWQDLGAKNVIKSSFEVYLTMHEDMPNDGGIMPTIPFTIEIETEKKVKTKTANLTPMKTKRIRVNNSGRMFRMRMIVPSTEINWQLATGIQIKLEYDAD